MKIDLENIDKEAALHTGGVSEDAS